MRARFLFAAMFICGTMLSSVDAEARHLFFRHKREVNYSPVLIQVARHDFIRALEWCRGEFGGYADVTAEWDGHYGERRWWCVWRRF